MADKKKKGYRRSKSQSITLEFALCVSTSKRSPLSELFNLPENARDPKASISNTGRA